MYPFIYSLLVLMVLLLIVALFLIYFNHVFCRNCSNDVSYPLSFSRRLCSSCNEELFKLIQEPSTSCPYCSCSASTHSMRTISFCCLSRVLAICKIYRIPYKYLDNLIVKQLIIKNN